MKVSKLTRTLIAISAFVILSALISYSNRVDGFGRPPFKRPFNERECMLCKFAVSLSNHALKTRKGSQSVETITNSYCRFAQIESPEVCSGITKSFNNEIVKMLVYGFVTPDQTCGYLSNNSCGSYTDPLGDWDVPGLDDSNREDARALNSNQLQSSDTYKLMHISDTHVDLFYKEGALVDCGEPYCCRSTSTPKKDGVDNGKRSGIWGSYGTCDVPMRTFESTLAHINSTLAADKTIDYIIWTGDIQPHDVWLQNKATAVTTYEMVFAKIFEYLPNIKIFPTLGNHEMIPVDSFSPSNLLNIAREDSPVWLYQKLSSYWSRWLPDSAIKSMTKDGFYSAVVRNGLKLISLNTNFCHKTNFWLYISSVDPGNQLQWLVHELHLSEIEGEKVHIIGHIPPGGDDCLKIWSKNYNKIVRRFHKTITGQFYGHTHKNEFEIFYDKLDNGGVETYDGSGQSSSRDLPKPIAVGLIGPSVTTFVDGNPSFRVYNIDPKSDHAPSDFETHFMNLTSANLMGLNRKPEWESSGSFSKKLGIKDISPTSLHDLVVSMAKELAMIGEQDVVDFKPDSGNGFSNLIGFPTPKDSISSRSGSESRLYELYRIYNTFCDQFGPEEFKNLSVQQKRMFLCKLMTSQSHNSKACYLFLSHINT